MNQHERNAQYEARCCDWHFGDGSGRGDPARPCQSPRTLTRAQVDAELKRLDRDIARANEALWVFLRRIPPELKIPERLK